MAQYILGRMPQAVLLLLLIVLFVFGLTLLLPGRPLAESASDPTASPADLQQLRHLFGLDQPAAVRYVAWLGGCCAETSAFSYRHLLGATCSGRRKRPRLGWRFRPAYSSS